MTQNRNSDNNKKYTDTIPLVVDLDGTFVRTDLLVEGFVHLIKKNPFYFFLCIFWLLKGKYNLKENIDARANTNYSLLPINNDIFDFIKSESEKGRKIILATASLQSQADEIRKTYPVFDEAFGSCDGQNLSGLKKSSFLVNKYGNGQFDYMGNSKADLPIFTEARHAYLINAANWVEQKAKKIGNLQKTWKNTGTILTSSIKAIRVYQWLKNLLLFVPLVTSHSISYPDLVLKTMIAFVAFGFIASTGYIINDLMDLDSDRSHPRKKKRPMASGKLSILSAIAIAIVLFVVGLMAAYLINISFFIILLLYFLLSVGYSIHFKKIVLYDVFLLAAFYTIRVISGGIVTDIPISFWLVAFSIFIFLSLAFVKRYSEIAQVTHLKSIENRRRDYSAVDLPLLQIMGIASGFMSVIVFSLYINSPEVGLLYGNPKILWFLSFLLLFWISRIWLVTSRGQMTDDPIVFTLKDPGSYVLFLLTAIILIAATYLV